MPERDRTPHYDWEMMHIATPDGVVDMPAGNLEWFDRYLIGAHYNAIGRALSTGETNNYVNAEGSTVYGLDYFEGMTLSNGIELNGDLEDLEYMELRGELSQGPYDTE